MLFRRLIAAPLIVLLAGCSTNCWDTRTGPGEVPGGWNDIRFQRPGELGGTGPAWHEQYTRPHMQSAWPLHFNVDVNVNPAMRAH
jgi:hypothetical protein